MLRHIYNPESFPDARTDRDEQAVAKYWNVFVLGVKYKYPELSAKALHAFKVALEQRRVGEMLDWMVPDVYNLESDDLRPLKSALVDNLSTKLSLVEGSEQESKFRDVARRVPESAEDIA